MGRGNNPPQTSRSLVLTEEMFNCGPRPRNWPSSEELVEYSSANVVDLTNEYWFWGQRCDSQLQLVEVYLKCFKDDKAACREFERLEAEMKRRAEVDAINAPLRQAINNP